MTKKAYPLFIFLFFYILFIFGCSSESESETILYPQGNSLYMMFPNDPTLGDSIKTNLSKGVMMMMHPQGHYTISFEVDPTHEAPKMQLFRFYKWDKSDQYGVSKLETLKPQIIGGRYVYSFVCEENTNALWGLTLVEGDVYYSGTTSQLLFEGSGNFSDHLSLNLISAGRIDPIEGVVDVDSLAQILVDAFRKKYTSFVIDTIYVRHAENHPTVGNKYPSSDYLRVPFFTYSDEISVSELGGWPETGIKEALDIVLVHRIESINVLGYAGIFSSNLLGGDGSTVIVGTHVITSSGDKALSVDDIVNVTLHETGHFFGLRHTTSTQTDLESYQDYSILEDGFEDTPFCYELLMSGLYKNAKADIQSDFYLPIPKAQMLDIKAYSAIFDINDCADANLIMFPVNSDLSPKKFSKQQLQFLKKSLMLIPH